MNANSSIIEIKGIGEKTRDAFSKLNIHTVGDLLTHYPRTYQQYPRAVRLAELETLNEGYYAILAQPIRQVTVKNGRTPVSLLTLSEGGNTLQLIWYHMPYDYMGIGDHGILADGTDLRETTLAMIDAMVDEESAIISIYYGEDVQEEDAAAIGAELEEKYPDVEVEVENGGQPIYYYVVSVE